MERLARQLTREECFLTDENEFRRYRSKNERKR
jgi:hypothetical protein